jgi:23S rRNA (uracil1939-C5)-methyltransferase
VELSGESLACAARNAPEARLLRGRTEDRLPQLEELVRGRRFSVYTNPPRSGHGRPVLDWFLRGGPERIAYLSCHPRSLAGDLRVLEAGFHLRALYPMDYFPQTSQVETLALLEKK